MTTITMVCAGRVLRGGTREVCGSTAFEETRMPPEVLPHHLREAKRRGEEPATKRHRRYLCKQCGAKFRVNIEEEVTS